MVSIYHKLIVLSDYLGNGQLYIEVGLWKDFRGKTGI